MANTATIIIGVYVDADPQEHLQATLLSLTENTTPDYELVLLLDGPAAQARAGHSDYAGIARIVSAVRAGPAAAFNSLWRQNAARYYANVECGTLPGPGWLERLLAAIEASADHAMAGPSSNRAWNEQQQSVPHTQHPSALKASSAVLAQRHGNSHQSLEPLYSLGSFCFLIRGEALAAVGGADSTYGTAACWEMDLNLRLARAGYRSLWVKGAFAHRMPLPELRHKQEQAALERGRDHYQQRFCGRYAGRAAPHCRGEQCTDFAPHGRISVRISAPSDASPWTLHGPETTFPMVSCVMPTRGRPRWVARAIRQFLEQDYPHRELIIVYDTEADLGIRCNDARVRYVQASATSIGAKRQQGNGLARGTLIAQWDDDDWYAPRRLRRQVEPLRMGVADVSGLSNTLFFDLQRWRFWRCSPELFERLFHEGVAGGTLVYRKSLWQGQAVYPALSLREDAEFLRTLLERGARLCRMEGERLFIYLRHGKNSWRFHAGQHLNAGAWQALLSEPEFFVADSSQYRDLAAWESAPSQVAVRRSGATLVSCIMPTTNRRGFVPRAIRLFLQQDYPHRELVILDDGDDPVEDLIPADPRIRYVYDGQAQTLGAKRNHACDQARGEIIVHWDDDDWMAQDWLSVQVCQLQNSGAEISGMARVLFYEPDTGDAWEYRYDGNRPWVCGGTLCYRRGFWQRNPFSPVAIGEDNAFVWSASARRIHVHHALERYVATIHNRNTSPKRTEGRRWHPYPAARVRRILDAHGENLPPDLAGLLSLT